MTPSPKRNTWTGLAIILVVVGTALLLANTDIVAMRGLPHFIRTYWPCVIIGIGISKLLPEKDRRRSEGIVYLGIGAFFQLMMLDWIPGGFASLWPVASIMFGLWIFFGGTSSDDRGDRSLITTNDFELDELFSSRNVTIASPEVLGGKATLTFAGLTMHLGDADVARGNLTIAVDAWCSSLTLRLPPGWDAEMQATTLVSRLKDRRPRTATPVSADRHIILQGALHFSSVNIQSPKKKRAAANKRTRP